VLLQLVLVLVRSQGSVISLQKGAENRSGQVPAAYPSTRVLVLKTARTALSACKRVQRGA
jgi:hypothetical protein